VVVEQSYDPLLVFVKSEKTIFFSKENH